MLAQCFPLSSAAAPPHTHLPYSFSPALVLCCRSRLSTHHCSLLVTRGDSQPLQLPPSLPPLLIFCYTHRDTATSRKVMARGPRLPGCCQQARMARGACCHVTAAVGNCCGCRHSHPAATSSAPWATECPSPWPSSLDGPGGDAAWPAAVCAPAEGTGPPLHSKQPQRSIQSIGGTSGMAAGLPPQEQQAVRNPRASSKLQASVRRNLY
jgi:hypothetical protein